MYIKMRFANIIIVLVVIIIVYVALIFPIFLNVKLVYNHENKKAYFLLEFFGFFKIISGYAQLYINKLFIHVLDSKAFFVEFIDVNGVKKSFKPFMDYHFISTRNKIELGSKSNVINPLIIAFIFNYFDSISTWLLKNRKPYLKINNSFDVYEEQDKFNIYGKLTITFNILMVIISIIKIILEKMIYEFRQSRGENK